MAALDITDIAAAVALGNLLTAAWVWAAVTIHKSGKFGFWAGLAVALPGVFVLAALTTAP